MSRSKQFKDDGTQVLAGDIIVGNVIRIQSFDFYIENADEYSLKYMERNPEIWPQCSLNHIAQKLRNKENELQNILLVLKERALEEVSHSEIIELLDSIGINLSSQEKSTLLRAIDKKKRGTAKFFRIFKLLQEENMYMSWSKSDFNGSATM